MDFEILRLYQADGDDERLVLLALNNADIGNYIVVDSTYDEKTGGVSNHFRHTFWFPNQAVKKGEKVILYTKPAKSKRTYSYISPSADQVGKHIFYWGVDSHVWNDDADSVTLIQVADWEVKKFTDIHYKK